MTSTSHSTRRQTCIFALLALQWVLHGWCLGGYPDMALWTFFGLSSSAFIYLFIPLGSGYRLSRMVKRLLKEPVFWVGLLGLLYILIQALNPAWQYETDGKGWWMRKIPHNASLPVGYTASFEEMNAFRMLVIFSAAWLTMLSVLLGLKRSRALLGLLWVFAINGVLFALVAILQRVMGVTKVLGTFEYKAKTFFGSFWYANHGAAYLYVILGVTLGLFMYYYRRTRREGRRSGPEWVLLFMAAIQASGFAYSHSKGALVIAAIVVFSFIALFLQLTLKVNWIGKAFGTIVVLGALIWVSAVALFDKDDFQTIERRFDVMWAQFNDFEHDTRYNLANATYEMWKDREQFGWGAGSFRYFFPIYQHRYGEVLGAGKGIKFNDAHSDWLQFLAEYGVVGCLILAGVLLIWLARTMLRVHRTEEIHWMLIATIVALFLHAGFDFILQAPSILLTAAMIMAISMRLISHRERLKKS